MRYRLNFTGKSISAQLKCQETPSKPTYLEKYFYMLPWCIFLEHWIRVFSHHIINCLYDIHHFLPWQHANRSTKRKLREMRAHYCPILHPPSPVTSQHLECLCMFTETDVPDKKIKKNRWKCRIWEGCWRLVLLQMTSTVSPCAESKPLSISHQALLPSPSPSRRLCGSDL